MRLDHISYEKILPHHPAVFLSMAACFSTVTYTGGYTSWQCLIQSPLQNLRSPHHYCQHYNHRGILPLLRQNVTPRIRPLRHLTASLFNVLHRPYYPRFSHPWRAHCRRFIRHRHRPYTLEHNRVWRMFLPKTMKNYRLSHQAGTSCQALASQCLC